MDGVQNPLVPLIEQNAINEGITETQWPRLSENYHQSLDVSAIAKFAGMGNSTLHHAFEKLVGQSPIQYLKKNPSSPGTADDRK